MGHTSIVSNSCQLYSKSYLVYSFLLSELAYLVRTGGKHRVERKE